MFKNGSGVLLDKNREEKYINKIKETYKLKDGNDELIRLELAILNKSRNNFEQAFRSLINNNKLDKLSEKICAINKIYYFIVSVGIKLKKTAPERPLV